MLTGKQKTKLRSLANQLQPTTQVGKNGVTDNLILTISRALEANELVKLSILQNCLVEPKDIVKEVCTGTNSELVQLVGRVFILYKPSKNKQNRKISNSLN